MSFPKWDMMSARVPWTQPILMTYWEACIWLKPTTMNIVQPSARTSHLVHLAVSGLSSGGGGGVYCIDLYSLLKRTGVFTSVDEGKQSAIPPDPLFFATLTPLAREFSLSERKWLFLPTVGLAIPDIVRDMAGSLIVAFIPFIFRKFFFFLERYKLCKQHL